MKRRQSVASEVTNSPGSKDLDGRTCPAPWPNASRSTPLSALRTLLAVVIIADAAQDRSILFCRSKHEEREIWDGFRYGPKAARKRFGFDEAHPIEELEARIPALLADQPALFYSLVTSAGLDAHVQRWLGAVRAQSRAGVNAPDRALDVTRLLDETNPSDAELRAIREAIREYERRQG